MPTDVVFIHPGAQHGIYGPLADNLTAIEPPTWTRMIAGWIRDRGFSIAIIDQEARRLSAMGVAAEIHQLKPRLSVIVVSGHQPSASTQQMTAAGEIAKAIKYLGRDNRILMCGNHPSALPIRTLKEEDIDYVADGEGPPTILGLLLDMALPSIPGLVFHNPGHGIYHNPPAPLIPIDELHGDVWDLLPMDKYRSHQWQCFGDLSQRQPYASIYTTLGCPHKCHFCMINVFQHANIYRRRNPMKVVDEIQMLYQRYGVRTFKFADEMFVLHRQHVVDICNGLIARGLENRINIWAYGRIDSIIEDLLPLMRRAGIRWLALGIESADESVRDGSQKHMDGESISQVVKLIQSADINVIANYIVGLPDDNHETMQKTLDLAVELNTEFMNVYSAQAYPGSPLYDQAVKEGWTLPESWSGYSQHNKHCRPLDTKHISGKDALAFRDKFFVEYFSREQYQSMIERKFGKEARASIVQMLEYKLERNLLSK